MKKLFTSSGTLWSCLVAMAMLTASQSAMAEYVKLTALSGVTGHAGAGEDYTKLVDANTGTKWGCQFDPSGEGTDPNGGAAKTELWTVVKAEEAVVPAFYFVVTGNDTGTYPERNWSVWKIYGGNFASDEEAVRGAEGWVLIDDKDHEPLPAENTKDQTLQFSKNPTTAYQYYWIEIEQTVAEGNTYCQMAEWGLGQKDDLDKYLDELANEETSTDEPVTYYILDGTKNDGSGEALDKLFDGNTGTKWGNDFTNRNEGETTNGAFFIIKASRSMAPSYYSLTTANDTKQNPGRNWKQWQIYGMNASSDKEVTRTSDKWVAIDKKYNVSPDQLPAENYTQVFFSPSEGDETEYRYFKVEIDQIVTSGQYMQMAEFFLGDQYTLELDKNALVNSANEIYDPDLFAEKALLDQMAELIATINALAAPNQLGDLKTQLTNLKSALEASAGSYAELITAKNSALNLIADDNLTDQALAYIQQWLSETPIAPNDEFPVGNLAYIQANRQLTGAEAKAEASRIAAYLLNNVKVVDDPIYVTYETIIDGPGFNEGERAHSLVDGDREVTKWCVHEDNKPWVFAFKSSEPIRPTYYGLVTGGDTSDYPDRNWTAWKIWAADFDSDEDVTLDSDAWVLIDEKNNVGTDILKTTSLYESYINLSNPPSKPYQYFKILVESCAGDRMQMNEFTFYNQGNLNEYREDFISNVEWFDPEERPAYAGYINEYKEKYQTLLNATNAPDVMKAYNDLVELQDAINTSADLYDEYQMAYDEVSYLTFDSESMNSWLEGYSNENVGASTKFIRGTYEYIMETLYLNNDSIKAETAYLRNILAAVNDDVYILLGGHTVGEWGDGYYGQIINVNKNGELEGGNDAGEVKWGGEADENGNTYVIFRTLDKTNPFFYTLTTGNDTQNYTGRNWGTWYIYGANFEGDGDATKDAEGWVLIDAKENVGQDRLHPVNNQPSYFGFSTETTEEYIYYKVVVTKAYDGTAIQMNELRFGTPEEFEDIKQQYVDEANEFDTEVIAEQALIDEYRETVDGINDCYNMEALFRANYELATLRDKITASANAYAQYQEAVDAVIAYLDENPLAESEALTALQDYLNTSVEPSEELYPNGSAVYIVEEHVLADSVVTAEIDFLEELKVAAVAAGYVPGVDVSSLIVNRSFTQAGSTLKDEAGNNIGREAEGWDGYIYRRGSDGTSNSAAEFCNENAKFDISQTLNDLKNGYYKVTLNAAFRANGSRKSYNYAAMAYANDVQSYLPVILEGAVYDKEEAYLPGLYNDNILYQCDFEDPTGDPEIDSVEVAYVVWSPEGLSHAIGQGRYAVTLVAKVTDGKLTIGVKNEGTSGNEWTGIGNFGLVYLGEDETLVNAALEDVADYNAARIEVLTEIYEPVEYAEDAAAYASAPGFGAAQKEAIAAYSGVATYEAEEAVGELMQSIYETKKAYVALFEATDKVYAKWVGFGYSDAAEDAVYEVRGCLEEGTYDDAEAAKAASAKLYADYPSYLELTDNKLSDVVPDEFTFDIITEGNNPYLDLKNLYEPLKEDEVILAFDYISEKDIEGSRIYYNAPEFLTDPVEELSTISAASDWTTAYVTVQKGINKLGFGSATNHGIRWYVYYQGEKDASISLQARNFRFITKAQMQAEGGKTLNGTVGDVNSDDAIDIADAVSVLNAMAGEAVSGDADVNGDGDVDIADFVTVLNIMAGE